MSMLILEARAIVRRLARRPGFFLISAALLGVGFGATLLVASIYDQIVLRALPVPHPDELVLVQKMSVSADGEAGSFGRFSLDDCRSLAGHAAALVDLACFSDAEAVVGYAPSAARVRVHWVTPGYFATLGVRPTAGRLFAGGGPPAGTTAAVLSDGAWASRFARDPSIAGRTLVVDGRPVEIMGVVPPAFRGTDEGRAPEVYLAATGAPAPDSYRAVGRLAPGTTRAAAEARLRALAEALAAGRPQRQSFIVINGKMSRATERIDVLPGARGDSPLRGDFSRSVLLAGGMLALVLVVLCLNLANVLAARAEQERRQNAVRRALGATRARIAAAWLGESTALCLAGALLGVLLARGAAPAVLATLPEVQAGATLALDLDGRVLLLATGLALATALLVGALAARQAARASVSETLRGGGRANERERVTWRWTLVGAQVGLSIVLLAVMGLLASSLGRLLRLDTGLPLERVLTLTVDLPAERGARAGLLERMRAELASLPGVSQVSYAGERVLDGSTSFSVGAIEGYTPRSDEALLLATVPVSPGFFETLGLQLLRGRTYTEAERAASSRAVVVSRSFAERYLDREQPLGRHISFDMRRRDWSQHDDGDLEVVGVVADAPLADVREKPTARVYPLLGDEADRAVFYVRAAGETEAIAPAVRQRLQAVIPTAALGPLRTLAAQRDVLLGREHLLRRFSAALGGLAALITAVGLFGVLSLAVRRRARELAVRRALGARGEQIARLVARDAGRAVGAGILLGIAAAVPATHALRGFLYGVEPGDPAILGLSAVALLAVAAAACWIPVRNALRTDPAGVLRQD